MNNFKKRVNIYPSMPITRLNPPIRSSVKNVVKSVEDIRTCLMDRAIVEEILPNGEIVRLNISNYNKCSGATENGCACGNCGFRLVQVGTAATVNTEEIKTPWQIAYDNALEGKNLASMTRKQRRSAEAAARAIADAAVAIPEPEVVIGVGSVETTEEIAETIEKTETVVEEETTAVEEAVEIQEEEVTTDDVEATEEVTEVVEETDSAV